MRFSTKFLIQAGLTIALIILLNYVFTFTTTFVRLSFAYLPLALFAMYYGGRAAALVAMVADVVGANIFVTGQYFPGFTVSAGLAGLVYGYFLHGRKLRLKNCIYSLVVVFIFISLLLNSLWLSILYQKAAAFVVGQRLIAKSLFLPVEAYLLWQFLKFAQRVDLMGDKKKVL